MGRRLLGQVPSLLGDHWRRCAAAVVLLRSQLARAIEARLWGSISGSLSRAERCAPPRRVPSGPLKSQRISAKVGSGAPQVGDCSPRLWGETGYGANSAAEAGRVADAVTNL
jgi:hypothetical protein